MKNTAFWLWGKSGLVEVHANESGFFFFLFDSGIRSWKKVNGMWLGSALCRSLVSTVSQRVVVGVLE